MDAGALTHRPVLLREALSALNLATEGIYVDGTFGRGGHAQAMLAALGPNGRLLALDRDPQAALWAQRQFADDLRFTFEHCAFGRLAEMAERHRIAGQVNGVLLDVGVSSPQLDDPQRGFSFTNEGPLDMRMDPATGISAAQWLASCSEAELARVLKELGEERYHRRIARAIVQARTELSITTTRQLAQIIAAAAPTREVGQHPATRSFQAIRIFINQELQELQSALTQALQILAPAGRLVVISFHSLEDRLVKRFMRNQARGHAHPPGLPVASSHWGATLKLIGRVVRPNQAEIVANPRARSALMRVAERLT